MTTTANESLQRESQTESCETRPYSAISEHSSVKGTPTAIRDWLTSFLPASHVNHSASPASERETPTTEISGLKPSMSFAEYDQFTHTWRTYQVSLLTLTPDEFTETWPKAGMTVSGVGYQLPKQELRIAEIDGGVLPTPAAQEPGWKHIPIVDKNGNPPAHQNQRFYHAETGRLVQKGLEQVAKMFPTPYGLSANKGQGDGEFGKAIRQWPTPRSPKYGQDVGKMKRENRTNPSDLETAVFLWPTPCAADANRNGRGDLYARINNSGRQKLFPTPASRDYRSPNAKPYADRGGGKKGEQLPNAIGGQLNPTWVEWLMGWPLGWTDLKPLEMDKYQQWCEQHGICWSTTDCQGQRNECPQVRACLDQQPRSRRRARVCALS